MVLVSVGGRRARTGEPRDSLAGVLPEGYRIEDLAESDAPPLARAYRRNRQHLAPWEPTRPDSFFTDEGQSRAVADQVAMASQGLVAAWVLRHGDEVVGRVNLNNIVMGVLRSASVGYWVDAGHVRRGLASGAVEFACSQAQGRGLHRVEAGTMLHNTASQRVLERSGFVLFGIAPRYLFIGGCWQDHRLYQRILHDNPI
jgi:[ribosomal protein S5]-alanine N-acetyltransferase